MNKEKQIKKMSTIIGNVKPFYVETIAEALYNAGYRKVPDGAVILTPEERDEELRACNEKQAELENEIERLKGDNEALKMWNDALTKGNEKLKKQNEIAHFFLDNALSHIDADKQIDNYMQASKEGAQEFAEKIKEYINNKVIEDFDDSESVQYYTIDLDEFECEIDELLKELTK